MFDNSLNQDSQKIKEAASLPEVETNAAKYHDHEF